MNRQDILEDIAQSLGCEAQQVPGDLADQDLAKVTGLTYGTIGVKRSRGDLRIPSYKIGKNRRTPLSAVIKFKLDQIQEQLEGMEAA